MNKTIFNPDTATVDACEKWAMAALRAGVPGVLGFECNVDYGLELVFHEGEIAHRAYVEVIDTIPEKERCPGGPIAIASSGTTYNVLIKDRRGITTNIKGATGEVWREVARILLMRIRQVHEEALRENARRDEQ